MKKIFYIVLLAVVGMTMYSCSDDYETYAEQRDYELSHLSSFVNNPSLGEIKGKKINVISEEQFLANEKKHRFSYHTYWQIRKIWYNGWYDNEYPDYVYIDLDVYRIYENPSVVFKRYEEEIAPGEFKEYREPQPAYAVYKKDEAVFLVEKKDPPGCFRLLKYKVDR